MGLNKSDARPHGVDLKTNYLRIKNWYQANIDMAPRGEYGNKSRELITCLKSPSNLSSEEMKIVFWEVLAGLLEWGYHGSDGNYKMGAYAQIGIDESIKSKSAKNLIVH